jgi:hypothetical protein
MSHTCLPLSATQLSSHKTHKACLRILLCRSSDDTRTSALNARNPIILVVSVITVVSTFTALQALLFFLLSLNFLHGHVGLNCFDLAQMKHFSNTCICLGKKIKQKGVAFAFTDVGRFPELLVILYVGNNFTNWLLCWCWLCVHRWIGE